MKQKLLLSILAVAALVTMLLCGCASSQQTAAKVLTSTALTVDAGMKAWGQWAQTHEVTEAQHAAVKGAYERYQASMALAVTAYANVTSIDKPWPAALNALELSSGQLLNLVHSLEKP